ncbi:MAG: sulfatase [Bryobacterales bacterium]|nr:sulfatase [Bryobacterales bacterium]
MDRRQFLSSAAALPLAAQPNASAKPNVLLILMDDMASRTLSCYGNPHVETPHLDQLAREGMRFTQAYVTPQCTPTRATLLTGQYTARNKMWHVIPWYGAPWGRVAEPAYAEQLPRSTCTLAKGMRTAGYRTACFGKWHLSTNADGGYPSLKPEAAPAFGFDEGLAQMPKDIMAHDRGVDMLSDKAVDFIERYKDRPWFCYLSHHAIHRVLAAPPTLVAKYKAKGFPDKGLNNATLLASMEHLDTGIGRVLKCLDDLNLRQNTVVIFLTDNGGIYESYNPKPVRAAKGEWHIQPADSEFESTPLRAGKGFAYEGGIRVPLIVRWPGKVKAGTVEHTPVHAVDLLPTLLDIAGAKAPASHTVDGVSLTRLWQGRAKLPSRAFFWYMPLYDLRWLGTPCAVIRDGDYKLIESFGDYVDTQPNQPAVYRTGQRLELYNLKEDIGETRNLAASQPQRAQAMQRRLHAWIESCGSPVPGLNTHYDESRPLEETRVKPDWLRGA